MTDRVQIPCLKQGVVDGNTWSNRVLTMDRQSGTLTISRHNHPNNIFYHSLKPSVVQRWPHFCMDAIYNDCFSTEAKRTLCVSGTTSAVPDFSSEEMAFVAVPISSSSLATPMQREAASTGLSFASVDPTRKRKQRSGKVGGFDAWMLRFPSKESYEVAVQMLAVMEGVRFAGKKLPQEEGVFARADTESTYT